MVRYRSRLMLLFFYYQIPHFYNNNPSLLFLIRRKFVWLKLYRITWFILFYYCHQWFLLIHRLRRHLSLILMNTYHTVIINLMYFSKTNQFFLINIPYMLLFFFWYNFNVCLYFYKSLTWLNILYDYKLNVYIDDLILEEFIFLKYLRTVKFQFVLNQLFYFLLNSALLNFIIFINIRLIVNYNLYIISI